MPSIEELERGVRMLQGKLKAAQEDLARKLECRDHDELTERLEACGVMVVLVIGTFSHVAVKARTREWNVTGFTSTSAASPVISVMASNDLASFILGQPNNPELRILNSTVPLVWKKEPRD